MKHLESLKLLSLFDLLLNHSRKSIKMAANDPSRLYIPLLNTGLQQKNNPLYQVVHDIIGHLVSISNSFSSSTSSGNSGGSSSSSVTNITQQIVQELSSDGIDGLDSFIPGPQGLQGIRGVTGIGMDGMDGLDGMDGFSINSSGNSGVDSTFTVVIPITGGTVVMNPGQQRIVINPAGSLLALTVTLPAGPSNNQIAGMAFTQIITGLTINAPGGATVVAPSTSAAVDSTFRFIYQASSTSWFPCS